MISCQQLKGPLSLVLVWVAIQSLAVTPPRDIERLKGLALAPKVNLTFGWGFWFYTPLEELLADASLEEQISELKRDVTQNPGDTAKHYELGRLLNRTGDAPAANASFQTALELARAKVELRPEDGIAHVDLGRALTQLNQDGEAEVVLRRATLIASNEWQTWVAMGTFNGKRAQTALFAGRMLNPDRGNAGILEQRPSPDEIEVARLSLREASRCFDLAAQVGPKSPEVYLQRAWFNCSSNATVAIIDYHTKGTWLDEVELLARFFAPTAIPEFKQAAALVPDSPQLAVAPAWFELAALTKKYAATQGQAFKLSGMPIQSRQIILEVMTSLNGIAENPNPIVAARALEILGQLRYAVSQEADLIMTDLRRAVALDANREKAWDLLIANLAQKGALEEQLATSEQRLRQKTNSYNHLLVAKVYFNTAQFAEAEQHAKAALRLDANYIPGIIMVAALSIRQDALPAATMFLGRARELLDQLPESEEKSDWKREVLLNYAILYGLSGESDKARELLNSFLAQFNSDQTAREILNALP
jgi:tetratricopeptide (TPR) repeat protein